MQEYVVDCDGKKRKASFVKCDQCDKEFLKSNSEINRRKIHCCSRKCQDKLHSNRIDVICHTCIIRFSIKKSRFYKSKSGLYFCSRKCKDDNGMTEETKLKVSDSISKLFVDGDYVVNNQYKTGHHTTWNNKKVFYRSSYELDYAEELDDKKIDYEMESLRIQYFDSKKKITRTAIPDFYLPDQNKIVEIKSNYTYDEQNMKDKFKAYKKHGYEIELILEHKLVGL